VAESAGITRSNGERKIRENYIGVHGKKPAGLQMQGESRWESSREPMISNGNTSIFEGMTDHRSYVHNLSSCEIKGKKIQA